MAVERLSRFFSFIFFSGKSIDFAFALWNFLLRFCLHLNNYMLISDKSLSFRSSTSEK